MKSKKSLLLVFILVITALISGAALVSCGATGSAASRQPQPQAPEPDRPAWVDNYPIDSNYYIGVGSSSTGNRSADMETAQARALASLASAISVRITSSQDFIAREDSEGKAYQAAETFINQSVTRNLREVDVYDSWYSERSGYWFYYRISRARWAEIEREEKAEILRQVTAIVTPQLTSSASSNSEILSALGRGWNIVTESPYESAISAEINNDSGVLIDVLENNIERVLNRVSINIEPQALSTEPGRYENINIAVTDSGNNPLGRYKIEFIDTRSGKKVSEVTTDQNGRYSGRIRFTDLPVGRNTVSARIAMDSYGISSSDLRKRMTIPHKDVVVLMDRIGVALDVSIRGEARIEGITESVRSLFSRDEFALKITSGGQNERFDIAFTMFFNNFPANAYGLYITNARAVITLIQDGSNLYTYETKEYREAGLDWGQAQERGSVKMFRDINADAEFISDLHKAIYSVAAAE